MLIKYNVPDIEIIIPIHCNKANLSRKNTKANKDVTAGVIAAIKVALATVEYCSPVNCEPLFKLTPVIPIIISGNQQLLGGIKSFLCVIFINKNKVALSSKYRKDTKVGGFISATMNFTTTG